MTEGEQIKQLRERLEILACVLADCIGISPEHLSNIEHGRRRMPCDVIPAAARRLNSPALLYGRLHSCPVYQAVQEHERRQPLRRVA